MVGYQGFDKPATHIHLPETWENAKRLTLPGWKWLRFGALII